MPGPKLPEGYARMYHQIMDILIAERPAHLAVKVPINVKHARATFNYFRQSWLRQYEFMTKQKSQQQADSAYQIYVKLMSYSVGIDEEDRLVFSSKEILGDVEFQIDGKAPQFFHHTTPLREKTRMTQDERKDAKKKLIPDFDEFINDTLKDADKKIREMFPKGGSGQVIENNPPQAALPTTSKPVRAPSSPEEYAFFLAAGRMPDSFEELDNYTKTGELPPA